MENEKRGISQITGKTEIKLGEKAFYKVSRIHRKEDHSKVKNALWKIYVNEKGSWRELKSDPSVPPKKGDEVSYTITNQALAGKELLVEAYIYEPERMAPPGLKIKVVAGTEKKIQRVELFMGDDTPIKEDTILKYNQTIKVKVYTQNMPNEILKLTLYEDDADEGGHNPKNEKNKVAYKEKQTNENGFLWYEFKLNAEFSKIANAMMDGSSDKLHEYYVLVESAQHGRKTSKNIEVVNPDYTVHQTYENGKVTDHKNDKIYEGGVIEEVIIKGKYKKQMGIDPMPKTGRSVSIVQEPPEKKENNGTCICKETKLYWGKFFTCKERKKIFEISKRLGCNPNHLTSAMALETGGTFDPSIVNSLGYTGLIQIGSTAAEDINRRKGTNVTAGNNGNLKNMTKFEQLTYVEYYLEPFRGRLNTLADFYLAILMPVDCGRGNQPNHVVFDKNLALDYKDGKVIKNTKWIRQRAYAQNPVFHKQGKNEDGKTYVWEIAEEIQKRYDKGDDNMESSFTCQESKEQTTENQNSIWHDPVDKPRLTKYNYSGTIKPSSGTYGWCRRNSDGSKKYHSGFDFFAIPGKDKVYACLKGNIHQVKYSPNAGWMVRVKIQNVKDLLEQEKKVGYTVQFKDELKGINIKETDDVYFIYMHLDSTVVTEADANNKKEIDAGTLLGYAGVSGSIASGGKAPHLHLEIATVLDAYGKGESVRTNPARFVKLNSYDTNDQDEAAKSKHYPKK